MSCPIDTNYLKRELVFVIWNNPCEAYINIRKQVEMSVNKYEEDDKINQIEIPHLELDSTLFPKGSSKEPVTWWN